MMYILYIVLICLLGILLLCAALLLALALFAKHKAFGGRMDRDPKLKYFSAEDFGLEALSYDIAEPQKDKKVRAVLYKRGDVPSNGGLVVFCHGMGPGQAAYTTEIAFFCSRGYHVFAPDYFGCGLSDGSSPKSFAAGTDGASAAVLFARAKFSYNRIYLVGHSWGGYAALTAAHIVGVDKAVALSAPDKPEKVMYNALAALLPKFIAKLAYPFLCLVCGGESAAECASVSNVPVLLIQGDADPDVPMPDSAYGNAEGPNVNKYLAKGKGHNPYNTAKAEATLANLRLNLAQPQKAGEEFFKNFDYAAATEEDMEVMEQIVRFLS